MSRRTASQSTGGPVMSCPGTQHFSLRYPATRWQDALPTGSGAVGAMLYGQVCHDTILLNHEDLYYPLPLPTLVDVSDQLPRLRSLIQAGQYREAAQVFPATYAERRGEDTGSTSTGRSPYQPFGAIQVATTPSGPFRQYRRGVDLSTGRVWMQWTDDSGTFTHEVFVSRLTDEVWVRIRGSQPGSVHCRIGLGPVRNEQGDSTVHSNQIPAERQPVCTTTASADTRTLRYVGHYPQGEVFGAILQVFTDGQVEHVPTPPSTSTSTTTATPAAESLAVSGASDVVLVVRLQVWQEPATTTVPTLLSAQSFDEALAAHSQVHGELFARTQVRLGRQPDPKPASSDNSVELSTEELLLAAYDGTVPLALTQAQLAFGRYLLICSSRPGGWPAHLQGIWNGDYAPAWNSDVHTDENVQMNYWQALPGNLPETLLPLFDYMERHLPDFQENARTLFGCRGIVLPIAMTTHGLDTPRTWSLWTAAAGWIAQHFYDYYLYTGDTTFLAERAVPWLQQVAAFYEDFLVEDDQGQLQFIPSLSPENRPANSNSLVSINATMDVAVCREVLINLCDACTTLGIDAAGVRRWQAMLARLPAYSVNEHGAIREWLHSAFADNDHHRHQSHLYPLFPGLEITESDDPALFEACRIAVERRLVIGLTSQTGWSLAHMANIYARLGEGDRARECLDLISRSATGPNLFTYHNDWRQMGLSMSGWGSVPPFQIDANLGFTAAILEMLVFSKPGHGQSRLGRVHLLPALPSAWTTGSARGIACRGGITVDIAWSETELQASLCSQRDQVVKVQAPARWAQGVWSVCEATPCDALCADRLCWEVRLKAQHPARIHSQTSQA